MTGYPALAARWDAAMMPTYGTPPVALARGEGCRVWDVEGREYLDLIAGIAVAALGRTLAAASEGGRCPAGDTATARPRRRMASPGPG